LRLNLLSLLLYLAYIFYYQIVNNSENKLTECCRRGAHYMFNIKNGL